MSEQFLASVWGSVGEHPPKIDWVRLGHAVSHYANNGFSHIEVPWMETERTIAVTCPDPTKMWNVENRGILVGSAEQSFIGKHLRGELPEGKYVACTPCFRIEDGYDAGRRPWFMKVELYQSDDVTTANLDRMVEMARGFFAGVIGNDKSLAVVLTPEGFDIELNGIEIGSYGIREYTDPDGRSIHWIYGTGLAEPRFSYALSLT